MQEKRRNKGNYHNIFCFLYAEVYSKTCGHRQGHAHFVPELKFDESFIFKKVPLSRIADAFEMYKTPGTVKGKILIDSEN